MATGFNLAGLTAYTNQQTLPLITKSLFNPRTISLINKQVGVKSVSALNLMTNDTTFTYGNTCGFSGTDNITYFTQRNLTAVHVKVHEELCPKTLEQYWMQTQLQAGSMPNAIPFEQVYTDLKVRSINKALETAAWQGTGGSGSITGFASIAAAASVTDLNTGALTYASLLTASNTILVLNQIETGLPDDIRGHDDVVIFCGLDVFTRIKQGLVTLNYFNTAYLVGAESFELTLPGTNIKLMAVNGLNGTYDLYAGRLSNFYFGTDLLNEEEKFEIFYAREADTVRFVCEFKAGFQIAFPSQCVRFMMAAS